MKPLFAACCVLIGVLTATGIAEAQDLEQTKIYGAVGYGRVGIDNLDLGAVDGRLGVRFGRYFAVEGQGAAGVDGESTPTGFPGVAVDVELKHTFAAYGIAMWPLSPKADLYARLGYGVSRLSHTSPLDSHRFNRESWNYGVGAQYFVDGKNGIRADFTRYDFTRGGNEAEAWTVSYIRRF